jgi:hypothetical protein
MELSLTKMVNEGLSESLSKYVNRIREHFFNYFFDTLLLVFADAKMH